VSRDVLVVCCPAQCASAGLLILLGLAFAPVFCAAGIGPGPRPSAADAAHAVSPTQLKAGRQAFATVASVLTHPRCQNCHPSGDAPLQFADSKPHFMNVQRGDDGRGRPGQRCVSCHGQQNLPGLHMPPGVASEWRLAPREMAFQGKTPDELAEGLAASGMSGRELLRHVEDDPLVLYGWSPGDGRGPVSVGHDAFVSAFETWVEAGMPRPSE
jgi:hypothetical protein